MPRRPVLLVFFVLVCGGGGVLLRLRVAPPPTTLPSALLGRNSPDRVCAPAYLALVVVNGADPHTRQLIRETWGHLFHSHALGLSVAFGLSADETADFESAMFGDLLHLQPGQDGPLDLLQAAREACRRPPFLAVLEKDVFVNTFALVDFLKNLQKRPLLLQHRNAIWCHVWEGDTETITSNDVSAPIGQRSHCLPGAFITVPSAADAILLTEYSDKMSQTIMSMTGVLAKEAGVELVQMADRFDKRMDEKRTWSEQTIFVKIGQDDRIMRNLWKKLEEERKDSGL